MRLAAAVAGDHVAFADLIEPYRNELLVHCYRMTGSAHDAEDVMQEVLVRAWRGLGTVRRPAALRAWLYRIATNACATLTAGRSRRVLPVDLGPATDDRDSAAEIAWLEPWPDRSSAPSGAAHQPDVRYEQTESLELAFLAALQYLPPNQRAALVIRDVVGFSARDAAAILGATPAAVESALQHARAGIGNQVPARSQLQTLRALGDRHTRALVRRYTQALEDADLDELIELLTEDATWSMPPLLACYRGPAAIAEFLCAGPFRNRWRHVPTGANGQLAVGCYALESSGDMYVGQVLDVLTVDGDRISGVTAFLDADLPVRFGLPAHLPADSP